MHVGGTGGWSQALFSFVCDDVDAAVTFLLENPSLLDPMAPPDYSFCQSQETNVRPMLFSGPPSKDGPIYFAAKLQDHSTPPYNNIQLHLKRYEIKR